MSDSERDDQPREPAGPATPPQPESSETPAEPQRRDFIGRTAMAAGLIGGYGAFGAVAARYLYPARPDRGTWQFVTDLGTMGVGESLRYRAPGGETINITRQAGNGDADDFIALSSTCPHLGCQVHWQAQNERYFCPCHNGTFDARGIGTGGPPGDAGQTLPRYPLRADGELLFILVPTARLIRASGDGQEGQIIDTAECRSAEGHDPCLSPLSRRSRRDEA